MERAMTQWNTDTNTSWVMKRNVAKWCECVCSYKVWSCYLYLCKRSEPFCDRPLTLPHTIFSNRHEQLISCALACVQPFHKILCKSVNPFESYAPFCNRPLPLPRPFWTTDINTNTDLQTHTHTWSPCQISAFKGKNGGPQRVGNFCGPSNLQSVV